MQLPTFNVYGLKCLTPSLEHWLLKNLSGMQDTRLHKFQEHNTLIHNFESLCLTDSYYKVLDIPCAAQYLPL